MRANGVDVSASAEIAVAHGPQELWLWEAWEEHLRLGFESREFWQACNCWNWSYWFLLVLIIVPMNMAMGIMDWPDGIFDAHAAIMCGMATAIWLSCLACLWLLPHRGHTVMFCVASSLFALHYMKVFLLSQQCQSSRRWQLGCAKEVVLTQPPLHLTVFVFSTCRLRPLLPVLVCGACCAVSLLWSLATSIKVFVQSPGEIREVETHTAIGSVLCCVALIFGAQAGAAVFKRQKDIFEYLSDHINIKRLPSSAQLACSFSGISGGAQDFFTSYIDRTIVLSFPGAEADEERRFTGWRLASMHRWLLRRGHYLVVGIGGLTLPYLWLSWDQYSRDAFELSCASLQTSAMLLALMAVVALSCCGTAKSWLLWVIVAAQLAFASSFLWCGGLGRADRANKLLPQAVFPWDPFIFLIFSVHCIWSLGVRSALCFDLLVLSVFCCILFVRPRAAIWPFMPCDMILVVAECVSLTMTLEKYDRILWKLHSAAGESPIGSFAPLTGFSTPPRGMPAQVPRDVGIRVVGFSASYSDDVFYFIEAKVVGCEPQVVLRSVPALRAAFLRLFESGDLGSLPFLERAFDVLADATELQIWRAARRLERVLRRMLTTAALARRILELREDTELHTSVVTPSLTVPRLNVLILTVGSRGDVQPFISLARTLNSAGHRCRLATHGEFEQLVRAAGVEFYPLATADPEHWQPKQLMQHMEANPGLGPEMLLRPQDLMKMLSHTPEMAHTLQQLVTPKQPPDCLPSEPVVGPWAAAFQADPITGLPFSAEAVIANPPSFAHIHIAERLGIPCHLAFTMPWTPTTAVGHPLSGPSSARPGGNAYWHKMSYRWVDNLQWSAGRLGVFINNFRRDIGLAPISSVQYENAPSLVDELKVPFMYFFSRALLQKPSDWGPHIDVCGFVDDGGQAAAGDAQRPEALKSFLDSGPPPVYIGFGSISSDLEVIARAAVKAALGLNHRVVLQRGWGTLGGTHQDLQKDVFYMGCLDEEEALRDKIAAGAAAVGALDHEWLFPRCRALVHHGGCGTTQCGIRHARPSVIVAFFGDQPLWGGLMQHQGAGRLVLQRRATQQALQEAIEEACSEKAAIAAETLRRLICEEYGCGAGLPRAVDSFHRQLPLELLACDVCQHAALSCPSSGRETRLARFFDAGSQLRLCDVCSFALVVRQRLREATGQPATLAPVKPDGLAVYRALDWGRGRRRWLRNLGASTAHAMEGVVALPFVGLRSGGLVGAAVGGVAGLLNLLVAPVTGARHLANQLFSRDSVHEDDKDRLESMLHLRSFHGRLQVGFARQSNDAEVGATEANAVRSSGERLRPSEEAAVCCEIVESFWAAMAFRERLEQVQILGHEEFAAALAGADWSEGWHSRALRSASRISLSSQDDERSMSFVGRPMLGTSQESLLAVRTPGSRGHTGVASTHS